MSARRLTRAALMEFPFEVLLVALGVFIGLPLLMGETRPGSLMEALPVLGVDLWALGVLVGGLTVAGGLASRLAGLIAAGLRLQGGLFLVYALALLGFAGFMLAGPAAAIFALVGVLAFFRARHVMQAATVGARIRSGG